METLLKKASRRRAFIAAPLLGAIVFLASILFVVNLSKQESANTALVVSEAYHNRLTSLLEVYRSDVAALFRGSLSQVVENFLAKQCWLNLFLVSNNPTDLDPTACSGSVDGSVKDCDRDNNGVLDLSELRYYGCKRANQVIQDSICALPPTSGTCQEPRCVQEKKCASDPNCKAECQAYEQCLAQNSYGLNKWIRYLDDTVIFEGIKYEIANKDQVDQAFCISDSVPCDANAFLQRCKNLLVGSIFDCDAFSKEPPNNMRCTDGNKVVEGCNEGNFFVKVSLTDPDVYPNLPRIVASDGFGNEIRSSAIGEEEYFYLPINYPLFKYYNNAFIFYKDLEEKNTPNPPSVPDGTCVAGTKGDCTKVSQYLDNGYTSVASDDYKLAQEKLEGDLFTEKIKPACQAQNKPNAPDFRTLQLCTDSMTCGYSDYGAKAWQWNCDDSDPAHVSMEILKGGGNALASDYVSYVPDAPGGPAAFYEMIKVAARFKDESPVHQVDPLAPNRFCAYVYQGHVCEHGTDANGFKKVGDCPSSGTS